MGGGGCGVLTGRAVVAAALGNHHQHTRADRIRHLRTWQRVSGGKGRVNALRYVTDLRRADLSAVGGDVVPLWTSSDERGGAIAWAPPAF
jgi:hypothetical protein